MQTERTLALEAMKFARSAHAHQLRKYTGNPYADHLAEVCGIAMSAGWHNAQIHPDKLMAVCWLHDCVEDQGVDPADLEKLFGVDVMAGVVMLSDIEEGNRAERKAASRRRLNASPGWVQTIKVADMMSNTSSIVRHDPKFAVTYLEEKRLMLAVLDKADRNLHAMAMSQLHHCEGLLGLAVQHVKPGPEREEVE
jgi:(p)ppGpp synthase/HD superfamily hydrolase